MLTPMEQATKQIRCRIWNHWAVLAKQSCGRMPAIRRANQVKPAAINPDSEVVPGNGRLRDPGRLNVEGAATW